MADADAWITTLRSTQDRFESTLAPLDGSAVRAPSYDTEWNIAQVASHLGSQAEIFAKFLDAGLDGVEAPGGADFQAIWDRWDEMAPEQQVADSLAANERLIARLELLPADQRESFSLSMFGRDRDLADFVGLRVGEHAIHTWDMEVALDPTAVIAPDAVELLVDTLPAIAGRTGKPADDGQVVRIETSDPTRRFVVTTGPEVSVTAGDADDAVARLSMPAESFIRLLSGRLDPLHTPPDVADDELMAELRKVFPGF